MQDNSLQPLTPIDRNSGEWVKAVKDAQSVPKSSNVGETERKLKVGISFAGASGSSA